MIAAVGALLAETRRRPGRVLLTGLAVTIATVFAAGTLLFTDTLRAYLTATAVRTPAAASVVVEPDGSGGDAVPAVAAVAGVGEAVGRWTADLPVRGATTWEIVSDPMRGPLSRLGPPTAGRLPATADEVAVSTATATRNRLGPGSPVTVAAEDGAATRTFTVTGVVRVPSDALDTVVATPAAVQGLGGQLTQIDVTAAPGVDAAALQGDVAARIGPAGQVLTGDEQRAAEVASASASANALLLGIGVFAGLALVAAAVVVASTFRIVLTQRRTQLALLRCVGAGRGQVAGAVLAEGAVTGLVAGLLGVGVAVGGGYGVLVVLRGGSPDVPALAVSWPAMLGAVALAVAATVLAALGPALAASRIPPVAALGTAGAGEAGAPRPVRRLALAAVFALVALGMATLAFGAPTTLGIMVLAASGMVAFAALVVAGPVAVRALAATVGRLVTLLGRTPGRLAVANAREVPRRTAATISVLALGVGLTSALLVALAATRAGTERSLAEQFPTDVVVDTSAAAVGPLAQRLGADPRLTVVRTGDQSIFLDPAPGVAEADLRTAVQAATAGRPGVVVQYAGDARDRIESTVDTVSLIGFGLVGMTALVAVVGVGVTLALSVAERSRETGLLRAVGLTRSGVRATVAWEAALNGAGAALVGAVLGSAYGRLGVSVLGLGGGTATLPVGELLALVVGVVAVAVLAAVGPAARAARVPPIRALQDA